MELKTALTTRLSHKIGCNIRFTIGAVNASE